MKRTKKLLFFILVMLIGLLQSFTSDSLAVRSHRLVVNGQEITPIGGPKVEDGIILVPIRPVAESLKTEIQWLAKDRKVILKKDDKLVKLKVESRLASYGGGQEFQLLDKKVEIIDEQTYVPLNFISQALDIYVDQDDLNRIIYLDSSKKSNIKAKNKIKISNMEAGEIISGKRDLEIQILQEDLSKAKEIVYMVLDPEEGQGFVIARGKDIGGKYTWLPSLKDKGRKLLAALVYDGDGEILAGDLILVNLDLEPVVNLTGLEEGEVLKDQVSLGLDINFIANYVNFEVTKLDTGEKINIGGQTKLDPYGNHVWEPMVKDNGTYIFKAIAYDGEDRPYESEPIMAKVEISPKLQLLGVKQGQNIRGPVNLIGARNFDVNKTIYIARDSKTGKEQVLKEIPYGGYSWFPGPEFSGDKDLLVRVMDTRGTYHQSEPIRVNIPGDPIILLEGLGPNQVINSPVKLGVNSNVELAGIRYKFTNIETGEIKYLDGETYRPVEEDIGYWNIQALAKYKGKEIESEQVPVRVYLGETHLSKPIIEKDKFLGMASNLAKNSWEKTGMSAALQTAQSILETGWGQSVPVDKYGGQASYNLFGIKGEGTAGSVTYNTWEVYNNKTYYVDANFRAYHNIEESWDDHKELLLKAVRYEDFRKVMYNSIQGAWALKRLGYATDPEYALKLIRLIKQYELDKLDRVRL